jgi:hypothetical protein
MKHLCTPVVVANSQSCVYEHVQCNSVVNDGGLHDGRANVSTSSMYAEPCACIFSSEAKTFLVMKERLMSQLLFFNDAFIYLRLKYCNRKDHSIIS